MYFVASAMSAAKAGSSQRLAGYLIAGAGVLAAGINPFPQIRLVAFELLHNGVDFPLLFIQPRAGSRQAAFYW